MSRKLITFALIALSILGMVQRTQSKPKTTAEWKKMSIYQVVTDRFAKTKDGDFSDCEGYIKEMKYCGGTWQGIINHLDYIAGMNYDAIWISPVWENLPNSYHGYSITNIDKLNHYFGTSDKFKELIVEADKVGISVMVDVVPNHMASVWFDYEKLTPFNKAEYFHDYCRIQDMDYQHNQWRITNCRLLDLPDLKQEHPFVRQTLLDHVENFVRDYGIAGLRLDAVPHMPHWFLREYYQAAKRGTVPKGSTEKPQDIFIVGECFDPRFDFVHSFQEDIPGLFNFPMFFKIVDVYKRGQHPQIIQQQWKDMAVLDLQALGLFIDNHDNQRFLFQVPKEEYWRLNNALAFIFYVPGIPTVYYGTEQLFNTDGDPYCRQPLWPTKFDTSKPIYSFIGMLNKNRKDTEIQTAPFNEITVDPTVYAFTRGNAFVVTRNSSSEIKGQKFTFKEDMGKGKAIYKAGQYLVNIEDKKDFMLIGEDLSVTVDIPAGGMPQIYNLSDTKPTEDSFEIGL